MSTLEVVFGIFPREAAMTMIAETAYAPAENFDQNRKIIEVINDQQLLDEDGKLNPSPAVAACRRSTARPSSRGPAKFPSTETSPSGPCWACPLQWAKTSRTWTTPKTSTFPRPSRRRASWPSKNLGSCSPVITRRSYWLSSTHSAGARTGAVPGAISRAASPKTSLGGARWGGSSP